MNEFHLKIKLLKPGVIEADVHCEIDMYLLEKGLTTLIRKNPGLKEVVGRALMNSMTPEKDIVLYSSTSN